MKLDLNEFLESNLPYYKKGATNQIDNFKLLILTYLRKFNDFKNNNKNFSILKE